MSLNRELQDVTKYIRHLIINALSESKMDCSQRPLIACSLLLFQNELFCSDLSLETQFVCF